MSSDPNETTAAGHVSEGFDLVAYADGTAPVRDQRLVEAHLRTCDACSAALEELRATLLLLEVARLDEPR